jgi:hypothetical protein
MNSMLALHILRRAVAAPRVALLTTVACCLVLAFASHATAVVVNGNIETTVRPGAWLTYSGATGSVNQTTAVGIFDSGDPSDTLSRETASRLGLAPVTPINPNAAAIARFQNQGTTAAQDISSGGWLGAFLNSPEQTSVNVGATDPAIRNGDPAHVFTNSASLPNTFPALSTGIRPFYFDYNTSFSENHTSMTYVSRANPANNLAVMVDAINSTPLPFAYDNTTGGNGRGLGPASLPLDARTSNITYLPNANPRVPSRTDNINPGFVRFVEMIPIEFSTNMLPSGNSAAAVLPAGVVARNTITVSNADGPNVGGLGVDSTYGLSNGLEPFYRPRDAAGTNFFGFNVTHNVANANQIRGGTENNNGFVRSGGNLQVIVNQVDGTNVSNQTFALPDQAPRPFISVGGTNYLFDTGAPNTSVPAAVFAAGMPSGNPNVRILPTFTIPAAGGPITIQNLHVRNAGAGTPIVGTDVTNRFGQVWDFSPKGGAANVNRGTLTLIGPEDPVVIDARDNGILFSVDSTTSGLLNTAVDHEKRFGAIPQLQPNTTTLAITGTNLPNEAAGTIFRTHLTGSNATYVDELAMGLDNRRRNVTIDAQSLGGDGVGPHGNLYFSVSRASTGQAASDVRTQAVRNQVAADIFTIAPGQANVSRGNGRSNSLFINQEVIGLGPNYGPLATATFGPGDPNDNLLDFDVNTETALVNSAMSNLDSPIISANDAGNVDRPRVGGDRYQTNFDNYFSTADSGIGDGARIFRSNVTSVFALGSDMGLADMAAGFVGIDDLDGLSLFRPSVDPGVIGGPLLPGPALSSTLQQNFNFGGGFFVFDPNGDRDFEGIDMFHGGAATDLALFSLAPGSQTLNFFGLSPADIFITDFDGTFSLYATAESLGLLFNDNVDGLDSLAIPEPASLVLVIVGTVGFAWRPPRTGRFAGNIPA